VVEVVGDREDHQMELHTRGSKADQGDYEEDGEQPEEDEDDGQSDTSETELTAAGPHKRSPRSKSSTKASTRSSTATSSSLLAKVEKTGGVLKSIMKDAVSSAQSGGRGSQRPGMMTLVSSSRDAPAAVRSPPPPPGEFDEYRFEYNVERHDLSASFEELEGSDPTSEIASPPPGEDHCSGAQQPQLSWWRLVLLNMYWFAFSLLWFTLLIVVVPSKVRDLSGDENKGHGMFVLFAISGLVTFLSSLLMGYANDRMTETKMGRRRPLILIGCFAMLPFLFGTSLVDNFAMYVFLYICLTIASVVSTVPYNGLFADVVPTNQHGYASAIMAALSQAGNLVGASLGLSYKSQPHLTFVILGIILTISMLITVFSTQEKPVSSAKKARSKQPPKSKLLFCCCSSSSLFILLPPPPPPPHKKKINI